MSFFDYFIKKKFWMFEKKKSLVFNHGSKKGIIWERLGGSVNRYIVICFFDSLNIINQMNL